MFFLPICVILTRSAQPAGFRAKGFAQKRALWALLGLLNRLSLSQAPIFPQDSIIKHTCCHLLLIHLKCDQSTKASFQEDAGIDVRQSTPVVCFQSKRKKFGAECIGLKQVRTWTLFFAVALFWNVQNKDGMGCFVCSLWPSQSIYSRHCSFQRKTGCSSLLSNRPLSVSAWFLLLIPFFFFFFSHEPAAAEGALSYPSFFRYSLCNLLFSL